MTMMASALTLSPGSLIHQQQQPQQQQQQRPAQPVTDADRLRLAFSLKNISQRCAETLGVLTSASSKPEFPSLVAATIDAVFGTYVGAATAWEWRSLSRTSMASHPSHPQQDFAALTGFFGAGGPFLEMVFRLTVDPGVAFNFPVAFLPSPARRKLQAGILPHFYRNKVKMTAETHGLLHPATPPTTPTHVTLNAFEYFLFHLAFYLVNPSQARLLEQQQQQQQQPQPANDSLFSVIFEHYLKVFLPASTEESLVPLSSFASAVSWASSPAGSAPPAHPPVTSPFKSALLKQSLCTSPNITNAQTTPGYSGVTNEGGVGGGLFRKSWRSETFLSVLVEFWLNQYDIEDGDPAPSQLALPTSELVRYVRQMLKQVHYFANVTRQRSPSPLSYQTHGTSHQVDKSMEEFGQAAIPVFVQKHVYAFLRFGFEKWPLDQGFRMMLETWLSYIQPWRYVDASAGDREEDRAEEVEEEWSTAGFFRDNLLHFVVPFLDFLKRLFRMDLSSPKNAQMLYRVCKVFNQPRLKEYLSHAEQTLTLSSSSALFSASAPLGAALPPPPPPLRGGAFQDSFFDGASYLSPSNCGVGGVTPAMAAQIAHLEKADFVYRPLFSAEVRGSVEQLLQVIVQALGTTKSLLPAAPKPPPTDGNFLLKLVAATLGLFTANGDGALADDVTLADVKRMDFHLRQSLQHLLDFFDLEAPNNSSSSSSSSSNPGGVSLDDRTLHGAGGGGEISAAAPQAQTLGPNAPDNIDGVLTDLGRWQLANGLRHFDTSSLGFQGDPDLHPILSTELAFLVRLLYRLSSLLNGKYGPRLESAYARADVFGRVARRFLLAPCRGAAASEEEKDASFSPHRRSSRRGVLLGPHSSKARLSLRFLADKSLLGWTLCALLFAPALGIGRGVLLFLLPIFAFFIAVIAALLTPNS